MTPYEAGYNAAERGFQLSANPFTPGTENCESWELGWKYYWRRRRELEWG